MKHVFIVNPTAGGTDRTPDVTAAANDAFAGRDDSFEIYVTKGAMDACAKVEELAATGEEYRVYACGGDGTFNECVCGAALKKNISLCPFPLGTGNDFCRMFGLEAELYRNLKAILAGTVHPMDLIDCNGRYCANICSVGIDARVGTNVHKYSSLPLIGGSTAYVVSTVVEVFKGIASPMHVECGDYVSDVDKSLVCVCNGRYYGGGFNPSLNAMPDDGELDIYIIDKMNIFQLGTLIGKYASGRADEIGDKLTHVTGTEISMKFSSPQVINIDGEAMTADSVEIKLVPGALNLIVPAHMEFFNRKQ